MKWLVFERETGVVVSCIVADKRPAVMGHHDVIKYRGDEVPAFHTIRVEDGEVVAAVQDLEEAKADKRRAIGIKRDAVQTGGCVTAKGVMQSDSESRLLLSGAIQMAQIAMSQSADFSIGWTMLDNTTVEHSALELIQAGMAMGMFISRAHAVAVALKSAVEAAVTVEEVEAINVEEAAW